MALRVYPATIGAALLALSALADTRGDGPGWWADSTAAAGAAASLVAAAHPHRLARFVHLLAAELAVVSRCLFIALGWAGQWPLDRSVLAAAVWAVAAVGTVTVYLAAIPDVLDDELGGRLDQAGG